MYWKKQATLQVSVKTRNDMADYDYFHKLNTKDQKWLLGFHREWANADFKHKAKKHYKTKKNKRALYTENNHRNNDLYGIIKWSGNLKVGNFSKSSYNKEQIAAFLRRWL